MLASMIRYYGLLPPRYFFFLDILAFPFFDYERLPRGYRSRDRMVVRFTTTYAIIAYHH